MLESHVRLAAYEGPKYDSKGLEESKQLKENARDMFPDLSDQQRAMLDKELENIEIAEVRRVWHQVELYKSKGDDTAVALYCNKILNKLSRLPLCSDPARRELEAMADRSGKGPGWSPSPTRAVIPTLPSWSGIARQPIRTASPEIASGPSDAGRARVGTKPVPQSATGKRRAGDISVASSVERRATPS